MATLAEHIVRPFVANSLTSHLYGFVRFIPDTAPDDAPEWLRGVSIYAGEMTPALAKALLTYNYGNRKEKQRAQAVYIRKMLERRWVFSGQPIIFARTRRGTRLLDGQNRLRACAESGVGFPVLVVDGVDVSAFPYLDRGVRRSTADNLGARGEKNAHALAAAAAMLYRWEKGIVPTTNHAVEPDDVEDILARHAGLRGSTRAVYGATHLVRSHAAAAFLHYEFSRRDTALADWFFRALGDPIGEKVRKSDGIYWLHRMLDHDLKASNRSKTAPDHIVASAIKAWNLHRAARDAKSLNAIRWRPDRGERFPVIQ